MHARSVRVPLYAAGLTVAAAATLAACGSSSGGSAATSASPLAAVKLAAQTSNNATTFSGTMSLKATATAGGSSSENTSLSMTFTERLKPTLLAQVNVASMTSAGTTLPSGMTEILTPGTLYMKWSYLTKQLHTSKQWIEVPLSDVSKSSGVNLSQIFSQASGSSPLTESQLLGGATSVRKIGTGTVNGVAVTEYSGKLSLSKGIKFLPASERSSVQKELNTAGIDTAAFTVWIDGKNTVRKAVINETGSTLSETITTTITSINQPVTITPPAADDTYTLPSGDL